MEMCAFEKVEDEETGFRLALYTDMVYLGPRKNVS